MRGGIRRVKIQGAASLLACRIKAILAEENVGENQVRGRAVFNSQGRFRLRDGVGMLPLRFQGLGQRQMTGLGIWIVAQHLVQFTLRLSRPSFGQQFLSARQVCGGLLVGWQDRKLLLPLAFESQG